jgi:hypothetical protein
MIDDEVPALENLGQLISLKELSDKFNMKPAVVSKMRWGDPKLPYVRIGNGVFFFEPQVVWWLNKWQKEKPDPYYVDRMRRLRAGLPVGSGRLKAKKKSD